MSDSISRAEELGTHDAETATPAGAFVRRGHTVAVRRSFLAGSVVTAAGIAVAAGPPALAVAATTYTTSGAYVLRSGVRVATALSPSVARTLANGLDNTPAPGSAYKVRNGTGLWRVSQSRIVGQATTTANATSLVAGLNANYRPGTGTGAPSKAPLVVPAVNGTGARLATVGSPGTRLALTGVAVWGIQDFVTRSFATAQHDNRDQVCATIASWGANHIRLRVLADEYDHLSYMGSKANYLQWVRDWVAAAKAHGLYVYLSWWDSLDSSDGSRNHGNWATQYAYAFPMMTDVHQTLKLADGSDDPAVFYEPFNEPNNVSWAQWLTAMRATISRWRATNGYQGVLVIDTTTWSHDYSDSYMGQLEAYDASLTTSGRHNLVFARHDYCNDYSGFTFNSGTWLGATGSAASRHVIMETEFGNFNGSGNTSGSWSAAITGYFHSSGFARSNVAGMTAFLFGNWYDANAMSSDPAGGSPNGWGNDVKGFLPRA